MADLSTADTAFIKAMTAQHKTAIGIAETYLKTSPDSRRANLSTMARDTIATGKAEMAKMASMVGGKSMMGDR